MFFYAFPITNNTKNANFGVKQLKNITAMKQTLSILLLLCLAMPLQAQSVLTGSVRSAESRQPVEFANVALFRSDSLLVGGAATDGRGRFRLAGIAAGRYALRVSCIGFQTAWLELQCAAGTADIGEITLTPESQRLDEALVQAASLRKTDRLLVYPSTQQLKFSANGFDLLYNLKLHRLWVDPLSQSVEIPGGGAVGFCINGKPAELSDVSALPAGDILRVEYIDRPSLRYKGYEVVLNYILKAKENGGTLLAEAASTLRYTYGGNLGGNLHHKQSEFGFNYGYNYAAHSMMDKHYKREKYFRNDTLLLAREWESREKQGSPRDHGGKLYYAHYRANRHYFNAALRLKRVMQPTRIAVGDIVTQGSPDTTRKEEREAQDYYIPSLELYYDRHLPAGQFLALNLVGTYTTNNNQTGFINRDGSDTLARSFTRKETDRLSWIGEAYYEKQGRRLQFTAGLKDAWSDTRNHYRSPADSRQRVKENLAEAWAGISLRSGKWDTRFQAGMYSQYVNENGHTRWDWSYNLQFQLNYALNDYSSLSLREWVGREYPAWDDLDATLVQTDDLLWSRGNPAAKPYTSWQNKLDYHLQKPRFTLGVSAFYGHEFHPFCGEFTYDDGKFILATANQKAFHQLTLTASLQVKLWKNYLALQIMPLFYYNLDKGNTYTHRNTSLSYLGAIMGQYKNWQLTVQARNEFKMLYGEQITYAQAMDLLKLAYRHNHWLFGFVFGEMLGRDYSNMKTGYVSRHYQSYECYSHRDKVVMLNISFTLPFGNKKASGKQQLNNTDADNGILRPML